MKRTNSNAPLTVEQASVLLGMGPQMIRWKMRHGQLPIGICVKSETRWKYVVYSVWLEKFLAGEPVQIPEGMSDKED